MRRREPVGAGDRRRKDGTLARLVHRVRRHHDLGAGPARAIPLRSVAPLGSTDRATAPARRGPNPTSIWPPANASSERIAFRRVGGTAPCQRKEGLANASSAVAAAERGLVPVPREVVHRRVEVEEVVDERMRKHGFRPLASDRRQVAAQDQARARRHSVAELSGDAGPRPRSGTDRRSEAPSGRLPTTPRCATNSPSGRPSSTPSIVKRKIRDAHGLLERVRGPL